MCSSYQNIPSENYKLKMFSFSFTDLTSWPQIALTITCGNSLSGYISRTHFLTHPTGQLYSHSSVSLVTNLITACNFCEVDHYTGSHSIFRNTAELVLCDESEIKEAGVWVATVHQNIIAAFNISQKKHSEAMTDKCDHSFLLNKHARVTFPSSSSQQC